MVAVPRFEALVDDLERLGAARDEVVLIGSATLAVHGLRDVNDLDVLCADSLLARLPGYEPGAGAVTIHAPNGMIQLANRLRHFYAIKLPFTEVDVAIEAHTWRGWLVLSPDHCAQLKKLAGREKDTDDLELLEQLRNWRN